MINKLVRDRIPEIIKDKWEECEYFIAKQKEYIKFLLKKVVEESEEVYNSLNDEELKLEIADLFEVIETLLKEKNINIDEIKKLQEEKRKIKWWFDKKIVLTKY